MLAAQAPLRRSESHEDLDSEVFSHCSRPCPRRHDFGDRMQGAMLDVRIAATTVLRNTDAGSGSDANTDAGAHGNAHARTHTCSDAATHATTDTNTTADATSNTDADPGLHVCSGVGQKHRVPRRARGSVGEYVGSHLSVDSCA